MGINGKLLELLKKGEVGIPEEVTVVDAGVEYVVMGVPSILEVVGIIGEVRFVVGVVVEELLLWVLL